MASILLSANRLLENPAAGTVIGTLSVVGGNNKETFTYTLADSLSDRFEIIGDKLVVKSGDPALFDYDAGQTDFLISVNATGNSQDGKPPTVVTLNTTINVIDNVAPTDITLSKTSVVEHSGAGTVVGTLGAVDPNAADTFSFSLVNGDDSPFEVQNGKLVVKAGAQLDFATKASYDLTIRVTDSDGNTLDKPVTINVTDALEIRNGSNRNEKIYGGEGGDAINGQGGNDWIYGNGGNDDLNGGSGNDHIYGGDGDDTINGGRGKDFLWGGAGKDTFVFDTPVKRGEFDQIRDFNVADDTIQINLSALKTFKVKVSLRDIIEDFFKKGSKGHDKGHDKKGTFSLDKVFKHGKLDKKFFSIDKAKDSNDFVYYNKKNGFVYLDVDGNGKGKGIEIVKLDKGLALTPTTSRSSKKIPLQGN